MAAMLQVFQAKVDPADAERLMQIRPEAMQALQKACPQLLRAELVRLDDETWLDVLRWSDPSGPDAVLEHAARIPVSAEMHALVREVIAVHSGEVAHTTQP